MGRILVTGSTTGLGLAAAQALHAAGHDVILHARNRRRAGEIGPLATQRPVVIGDLSDLAATRQLAADVNGLGHLDAVIHNAGVYSDAKPNRSADGHPRVLTVNVLAPYVLTALIERPARLIYLSSGMHASGRPTLD